MAELPAQLLATLREVAESGESTLFLTGAGISAESGIPTFRGPEGYWTVGSKHYHPMELATQQSFRRMPDEVWRWYLYRRSVCNAAQPNAGHRALVDAEHALADRFVLVTQNVDGLHLRAGNSAARTRQIHGNTNFMRCLTDGREVVHPIPEGVVSRGKDDPLTDEDRALLTCPCGKRARPHVLWFDEYYDERLFHASTALQDAQQAGLLVIVGTAGATNLPHQITATAVRRGIPIVDINLEDNPFSEAAAASDGGAVLRGTASELLVPLVRALCNAS